MNSPVRNTLGRSKLFVLSAAVLALTLFAAPTNAQHLQQGVSVQLAPTTNANSMPAADNEDAWIVAITADGRVYFGIDPVDPASLADAMKSRPRNRDQNLYIKADARARFADVSTVLTAAHDVAFDAAVLLTSQTESVAPGTLVPPKGLEVLTNPTPPSGTVATVVQVINSGKQPLVLKINNQEIAWSALQGTLSQHFQKGDDRVVLVKAAAQLPFAEVVHLIDLCRAAGAKVVLATSEL